MTRITIKPVKGQYKTNGVYKDGALYATYQFDRRRQSVRTPAGDFTTVIRNAGTVTYADGRTEDLSYYSWAVDIARDFRNGTL